MDKCITCQYYDRKHAGSAATAAPQWGQCRRTAPMLNPSNTKSYMIEGVWPTVRDDDWCGEWKVLARRAEPRVAEVLGAATLSGAPSGSTMPRISPMTAPGLVSGHVSVAAIGAARAAAPPGTSAQSAMGVAGSD